jgi:EmrB/QacA subfamily drug resistance transporter
MADKTDGNENPVTQDGTQKNQWWLVIAAALAVFMASVDMSIVNIALPAMESELGIDTSVAEWVVLAYLLPLAGLALSSGRWLDTVGRRPALMFSLVGFALASLACGLSPNLTWLIVARLLQGTFGALLFSLVPALATTAVKPQARGRAMAVITTLGPIGLISGPGLGGVIVDALGWSWIFFVNVPVSLLVMAVGWFTLKADKPLRAPDRGWFAEALLLSGAVAAFLLSLSLTASSGPVWLLLALVSVPLVLIWLRMSVSDNIRSLFRAPGEVGPHLALLGAATAIGTVFFIMPYFMERELHIAVPVIGATVLLFPLGMAVMGPVGGVLGDWWGSRSTAIVGTVLFTAGLALLLPMDSSWGAGDLAWRLFLAGAGNGLFNAPNMAMAMGNAPPPLLATTGSSTNLARTMGFALGPALATLVWSASAYGLAGMRGAIILATVVSALSVVALVRTREPEKPEAPQQKQPAPQQAEELNA